MLRTPRSSRSPRARFVAVAMVLATGLLTISVSPALAAPAADGAMGADPVGVSLRPADSTGAFDGRTNFRYSVKPGQTVKDFASVVNTGTEKNEFTLIGTDAFNDENGDFALLPTDQAPKQVGPWVTFENGSDRMKITLEPGEGRLIPFSLNAPTDATPGDHAGGIVASVLGKQGQVQVDRRVAIRLYARVAGDLQPNLTISSLSASYVGDWWNLLSGTVDVKYTVTNPGNVALAANLDSGVKTWFGAVLTPHNAVGLKEILPGNSASYKFSAPGIAQWLFLQPYVHIEPFVDSTDVKAYTLAAPSSRDTVLLVAPWLVLIALLIVGGLIALIIRRRRQENDRAIEWAERAEQRVRDEVLEEANAGAGQASHRD